MVQWICIKFGDNDSNTSRLMHIQFTLNSVQVCTWQYKMFRGIIFYRTVYITAQLYTQRNYLTRQAIQNVITR